LLKFGIISEAKVSLHGHLISDGSVEFDNPGVMRNAKGVEDSVEIGMIAGELFRSLGKNETDGFEVHGESGIVIRGGFDRSA
jgi:hypothetical protein